MGKRKKASKDRDPNMTPKQKRAKAKDARDAWLRACDTFVTTVLLPKMEELATTHNRTMAEVRTMLSLGVGEAAKKRQLRLWEAAMHVALKDHPDDFKEALAQAKAVNDELKDAIAAEDFDNELLKEYQGILAELEDQRSKANLPSTEGKTERSVQLTIGRMLEEVKLLIRNLHFATDAEYMLVVCKGNQDVEFPPFVETSARVDGFLEFRMHQDARKFAIAMEGHVLWGADALQLARTKDIPHKTLFSKILGEQIQQLTKSTNKMQWANWQEFKKKHNLELIGWPDDITFKPLHLLSSSQAKRLHKLARDGTLRIQVRADITPSPSRTASPQPALRQSAQLGEGHSLQPHVPHTNAAVPPPPPVTGPVQLMRQPTPASPYSSSPIPSSSQLTIPTPHSSQSFPSLPSFSDIFVLPTGNSGLFGSFNEVLDLSQNPLVQPHDTLSFSPSLHTHSFPSSSVLPPGRRKSPVLPLPDHILNGVTRAS